MVAEKSGSDVVLCAWSLYYDFPSTAGFVVQTGAARISYSWGWFAYYWEDWHVSSLSCSAKIRWPIQRSAAADCLRKRAHSEWMVRAMRESCLVGGSSSSWSRALSRQAGQRKLSGAFSLSVSVRPSPSSMLLRSHSSLCYSTRYMVLIWASCWQPMCSIVPHHWRSS